MSSLGDIWQAIHQVLSDPVMTLVISSGLSIVLARKSSRTTNHPQGKKKVEIYTAQQWHSNNTSFTHPQHVLSTPMLHNGSRFFKKTIDQIAEFPQTYTRQTLETSSTTLKKIL
jgi:hypothetical protein